MIILGIYIFICWFIFLISCELHPRFRDVIKNTLFWPISLIVLLIKGIIYIGQLFFETLEDAYDSLTKKKSK